MGPYVVYIYRQLIKFKGHYGHSRKSAHTGFNGFQIEWLTYRW